MTEEYDGKKTKEAMINLLVEEKHKRYNILEGAKMVLESTEDLEMFYQLGDKLSEILKETDIENLLKNDGDVVAKGQHTGINGLLVLAIRAMSDPILLHYLIMATHQAFQMDMTQPLVQRAEKANPQEEAEAAETSNGKGASIVAEFERAQKEGKIH